MLKLQRSKYQSFVRARNFGFGHRDLFPEQSAAGKSFVELALVVTSIEEQITRQADGRANAGKVNANTRRAAMRFMRAIAVTGRRVARRETGAHPFRMPAKRTAPEILGVARLFRTEAERRKERFVELGMTPTFLTDFDVVIKALEDAIIVQQDSRGERRSAKDGIEAALAAGMILLGDLDVTVTNALQNNPSALGQWIGARRVDYPVKPEARKQLVSAATEPVANASKPEPGPAVPLEEVVKVAS